jgi:hypothetical protein
VSPDLIAVGVFTLLGVALGLVGERWLRRRREVSREVKAWVDGRTGGHTETRQFEVRFFNNKDVNIAVWDPKVEFYEGAELVAPPMIPKEPLSEEPIGPTDLPSRTSVYRTMWLQASEELLEKLKRADRGRFVARVVPGRERIEKSLPPWTPYEQAPP